MARVAAGVSLHWGVDFARVSLLLALIATGLARGQEDLHGLALYYGAGPGATEESIVVANNGIRVPFGRWVDLDPVHDLVVQVEPGDHCSITVLDNDPLSQRPGQLSPRRFPCEFGSEEVRYSHYGSRSPSSDRVRLQLRYDTHTDTLVVPFTLQVEVVFTQLEVVTRNMPLVVEGLLGTSQALDSRLLELTYQPGSQRCQLTPLPGSGGLPRYGRLLWSQHTGQSLPCEGLDTAGMRYQHTAGGRSPSRDYIPMLAQLLDQEGRVVKREHFQIAVRIRGGEDNTAPRPSFLSMMMMQVDQFVLTAISPDMLAAEDAESEPGELVFNITSPLDQQGISIVSTDDQSLAVRSFSQRDVEELRIACLPPAGDSDSERVFQLEMQVVDTEGAVSEPFAFVVVVKPMNTLAPVVSRGAGLVLYEGQSRPLSGVWLSDEDNLGQVQVWVADGLRHGSLAVLGTPRNAFTAAELRSGAVVYQHDGSETHSDNVVLAASDGQHTVRFLCPVTVVPTDDQPPLLNANTGLVLPERRDAPISPLALSATDVDSEDSTLLFVLETPISRLGQMVLRQSERPLDPSSWTEPPGRQGYERVVREWTQMDIVEGRLFYRHVGPHSTSTLMDQVVFRVQDDNDPPNRSGQQSLVVKIQPVDDVAPEIHPGATLHMVVEEYRLTHFTRTVLRYTDVDTPDRELRYTVTSPPTDTDSNSPAQLGNIVLTDSPSTLLGHFTQAQVNHHKVAYRPPDTELGIAPRALQFHFSVEDGAGNVARGTCTILLQPVDNQPPRITNTGLNVRERGTCPVTSAQLHATDADTPPAHITFTLARPPAHGQLLYDGVPVRPGEAFNLHDMAAGRVSYTHGGGEAEGDWLGVEVGDGVHTVPITVRVTVRPVDDEAPTIALGPGTVGLRMDVLEGGVAAITSGVLRGTDPDTDDARLAFTVEEPPLLGQVVVGGVASRTFTQGDILGGSVMYAHTGGELGPHPAHDTFNLTLSDMSDNQVRGVQVRVTLLPVDNQAPGVALGEMFAVVEGEKTPLTGDHLRADDPDSPADDILCTIVGQPKVGYVENISPAPGSEKSRAGTALTAFSMKDVRLGHINYVQSIHRGVEPVEDRFTFHCSDGVNVSPRHLFPISITPANDETPEIFMRELVVLEGMSLVIDTPVLNAADADLPADQLAFTVASRPAHGRLVQQTAQGTAEVHGFTLEHIAHGSSIVYQHDDSESTEDTFQLLLTDGEHVVEGRVVVMVIPVDDETPRMAVNAGLEVEIGETRTVGAKVLKATDLDSDDEGLVYTVRYGPSHGLLQRRLPSGGLANVTGGMNFTQADVDQDVIQYSHTGQHGVRDLLKFDVTDGLNPLIDRYFYVTIGGLDTIFPDVVSKGVSLREGGRVTLTTDLLSTSDLDSPDQHLVFTITRAPVRGHLECSDLPGVAVSTFSQLQLAGNKVSYIHTAHDEAKMDSFEFQVTDGRNPVFRTFRISISGVDNRRPVLTTHLLLVDEGGFKLITPFELTVEDRDTPDPSLRFTVTQPPVHGRLLYNHTAPVTTFTKQDLNDNLISYRHDGAESPHDSFSFTVTDGTHAGFYVFPDTVYETRRPQTMWIRTVPVDDGVPQVVVNRGAPTLRRLATGHLGFTITSKALRAQDRDSVDNLLKYKVGEGPQHGYITHMAKGNGSVSRFTQGDVNDMNICYILKEGANATSDIFHFTVEDNGGNKLPNQLFRLNWAWISLEKEYYVIDENSKFLVVILKRRGYLGETSFVGIGTKDVTAQKDKDFRGKSQKQVQFNPGQSTATWRVQILTDHKYEQSETFQIVLSEPVMAVLEFPEIATVEILDPGDESTVFIVQSSYAIDEHIGELLIPVMRTGDVSLELMVMCFTQQGTARGTVPSSVLSYSDYITRPEDHKSVLRFDKDETERLCQVVIIDDSLYESEETFNVTLSMPMGGRLGDHPSTQVFIVPDPNDEPVFYFGDTEYWVDESDGYVEVQVWRTGTDLSKTATVTVRSRKTQPASAEAGVDYVGISSNLDFAPGVSVQALRVTILDDLGRPVLEGTERFELVLRMPMNGALGEPSKVTVLINDSVSDLPKVQFKESTYVVKESDGQVTVVVYRSGDINYKSSVRCYTRQASAQVMMDFAERPNTDESVITFLPGEIEKPCTVTLSDDSVHEEVEELRLVLGSPKSESSFGASIGGINETLIKITDKADKAVIKFGEAKFSISEPKEPGQIAVVKIPVLRQGDVSKVSIVRVHTKDGSAVSGEDYNPLSEDVQFKEGDIQHFVEVEVLYDGLREMREAFTVHLKPDENMVAEIQINKAIVYIEEMNSMADVMFPSVPQVVSLLIYDDTSRAKESPSPPAGYPLICVTACNPKYADYDRTGSICGSENINDTLSRYRWLVSAPTGHDGVTSPLREVDSNTFFTSSKMITLDSIYFQAGSRVQCAARAVNANGDEGLELSSPIITVSTTEGLCQPRVQGTVGAEPFSAKLRYTGTEDPAHTNLVKLTVTMPHIDGMLPVISTRQLFNFELALSPDGTRVGNHRCSNLLDHHEVKTHHGFLSPSTRSPQAIGETSPYQYSDALRGSSTLRFYRNLNLDACLWQFQSFYDMSELLTDCGGTIGTDGQVLNLVQSYVTLRVPLYVSYVFHSPVGVGGWQHFDLQSELRLTFVYDTAILWRDGVGSPPEAELQGALYPTSMRINTEGRLVVNFRTEARFRGLFVMWHPASALSSMVVCADHPGLTFTLSLVRSEHSYNHPEQQWRFTSDFAVRDYSGTYTVKLIPCASLPNQDYTLPIVCNPREPIIFDLDIRFQQVSDPVPTEFSLNTQMFLLNKKSLWLSDGSMGFGEGSDVAFTEGSVVYGRVMVDPVQNLGDSFFCNIEKVFLCTGADGYVPKYNPLNTEYGCVADSPSLLYQFKILDKAQPETQDMYFGSLAFNARLAIDDYEALGLATQPGSDGFHVDSSPLFQVTSGREWYIHTIYTVRSGESAGRGIGKRSLEYHAVSGWDLPGPGSRRRRSAEDTPPLAENIGADNSRGTNIQHVALQRGGQQRPPEGKDRRLAQGAVAKSPDDEAGTGQGGVPVVVGGVAALLLAICAAIVIVLLVRRRRSWLKKADCSNPPVGKVGAARSLHNDSSEV
ncbi:FRAS1-related extracellular matrix protein 2-like [Rhinoraja longicauda]